MIVAPDNETQRLLQVPQAERDDAWFHDLFVLCERARFVRSSPPGFINPAHLPFHGYELAPAEPSVGARLLGFRHIVEIALVSGAGLRLFAGQEGEDRAALVSYGLLWSYFQFGDVRGDPIDAPDGVLASMAREEFRQQGHTAGRGIVPVNDHFLPPYVRRGLHAMLEPFSEHEPLVAMLVDLAKPPLRTLLVHLDSTRVTHHEAEWFRKTLLAFCMPPHRYFNVVTETDPISLQMQGMVLDGSLVGKTSPPTTVGEASFEW
jgi:hypothetical protein